MLGWRPFREEFWPWLLTLATVELAPTAGSVWWVWLAIGLAGVGLWESGPCKMAT